MRRDNTDQCVELYDRHVLLPRLLMSFLIMCAALSLALMAFRCSMKFFSTNESIIKVFTTDAAETEMNAAAVNASASDTMKTSDRQLQHQKQQQLHVIDLESEHEPESEIQADAEVSIRLRNRLSSSVPFHKKPSLRVVLVTLHCIVLWRWLVFTWSSETDYSTSSSISSVLNLDQPRMVFSFTTTSTGISSLEPTLRAALDQQGRGFDAVYVIVPKFYRDTLVKIPSWLLSPDAKANTSATFGWNYSIATSNYDKRIKIVVIEQDFGPASKLLGTLLEEQDPDTIIVYGDDDRNYPKELTNRVLYYSKKYGYREALAVMGGWIGRQNTLYCGRALEVGVNAVSFVAGAGAVAVRRKFFDQSAFDVMKLSRPCFLGDDLYLSYILHRKGINKRIVVDSCWNKDTVPDSYERQGLAKQASKHPGGSNVANYQQCMNEIGDDVALDSEFGYPFMHVFSQLWGILRSMRNVFWGDGLVPC